MVDLSEADEIGGKIPGIGGVCGPAMPDAPNFANAARGAIAPRPAASTEYRRDSRTRPSRGRAGFNVPRDADLQL